MAAKIVKPTFHLKLSIFCQNLLQWNLSTFSNFAITQPFSIQFSKFKNWRVGKCHSYPDITQIRPHFRRKHPEIRPQNCQFSRRKCGNFRIICGAESHIFGKPIPSPTSQFSNFLIWTNVEGARAWKAGGGFRPPGTGRELFSQ